MKKSRTSLRNVVGVAAMLLALASCDSSGESVPPARLAADDAASPSAGDQESAAAAHQLPPELQGTWLVQRSRAQMRADMTAFGFARYAPAFFRAEHIGRRVTLAVTYTHDSFSIAWRQADGTWYVGWYGPARVDNGVLTVTDAPTQADDQYAWRLTRGGLTLHFRHTTTPDQHGIPFEAYSRAYFTRPLQAVDCTSDDLDACLQGASD